MSPFFISIFAAVILFTSVHSNVCGGSDSVTVEPEAPPGDTVGIKIGIQINCVSNKATVTIIGPVDRYIGIVFGPEMIIYPGLVITESNQCIKYLLNSKGNGGSPTSPNTFTTVSATVDGGTRTIVCEESIADGNYFSTTNPEVQYGVAWGNTNTFVYHAKRILPFKVNIGTVTESNSEALCDGVDLVTVKPQAPPGDTIGLHLGILLCV